MRVHNVLMCVLLNSVHAIYMPIFRFSCSFFFLSLAYRIVAVDIQL